MTKNVFKEESRKYVPTPESFRKEGEKTHGKGRHKPHKVGDFISFKTPRGRARGKVLEAHREFYIVDTGRQVVKVNRNSILYALGSFVGRVKEHYESAKSAVAFGREQEREKFAEYKRKKREEAARRRRRRP